MVFIISNYVIFCVKVLNIIHWEFFIYLIFLIFHLNHHTMQILWTSKKALSHSAERWHQKPGTNFQFLLQAIFSATLLWDVLLPTGIHIIFKIQKNSVSSWNPLRLPLFCSNSPWLRQGHLFPILIFYQVWWIDSSWGTCNTQLDRISSGLGIDDPPEDCCQQHNRRTRE